MAADGEKQMAVDSFGDHRDWPVIDAWADTIVLALDGARLAHVA